MSWGLGRFFVFFGDSVDTSCFHEYGHELGLLSRTRYKIIHACVSSLFLPSFLPVFCFLLTHSACLFLLLCSPCIFYLGSRSRFKGRYFIILKLEENIAKSDGSKEI